ncbi:MAG: hypothetical protein HY820_09335 [Acidobacteria bacterium]|nr:hypothetical protein [Acidobacteriota bacterium]
MSRRRTGKFLIALSRLFVHRSLAVPTCCAVAFVGPTFCPLGDAAALPTESIVRKFRHEFEAKIAKTQISMAGVASPFVVV